MRETINTFSTTIDVMKLTCDLCHQQFNRAPSSVKNWKHVFCCAEHRREWFKINKAKCECEWCGKEFTKETYRRHSKHFFCCKNHFQEWKKEQISPQLGIGGRIKNRKVENARCYLIQARRMLEGKSVNRFCVELPETCI